MNFLEERFPEGLSFGSSGGPERRTEIVTLSNGFEERNTPWTHSRRRFDAGVAMRSLDDMDTIISFFETCRGSLYGFRWKDWTDFKSCLPSKTPDMSDQNLGIGDGQNIHFQLCKIYKTGPESYCRDIKKPVPNKVLVGLDGNLLIEGQHYFLDPKTGDIQFSTTPVQGAVVTAGYEFDVPVRFDTDRLEMSHASFLAGEIPSVPVVELRV